MTPEGVFLDIIDDFPCWVSMQDTGRVTEYFYSFGERGSPIALVENEQRLQQAVRQIRRASVVDGPG